MMTLNMYLFDFAAPKLQCTMLCRLGTVNWDENESEWMCVEVWKSCVEFIVSENIIGWS